MRADSREAVRIDRALDRASAGGGGDDEVAAYNAMLTRLAEQETVREAQGVLRRGQSN
jgi:hypothetical protein